MHVILIKIKESNLDYISHKNIKESHIDEYTLDISRTAPSILSNNLITGIHNKEGSCLNNLRSDDNLRPESETTSMNSVPNDNVRPESETIFMNGF